MLRVAEMRSRCFPVLLKWYQTAVDLNRRAPGTAPSAFSQMAGSACGGPRTTSSHGISPLVQSSGARRKDRCAACCCSSFFTHLRRNLCPQGHAHWHAKFGSWRPDLGFARFEHAPSSEETDCLGEPGLSPTLNLQSPSDEGPDRPRLRQLSPPTLRQLPATRHASKYHLRARSIATFPLADALWIRSQQKCLESSRPIFGTTVAIGALERTRTSTSLNTRT